jgi:hypothetical protein
MSSSSLSFQDDFNAFAGELKRPPAILFLLGLISVVTGIGIAVFAFVTQNGSTDSRQQMLGAISYILSALIPIVLFEITRLKHKNARSNRDEPYDDYAGIKLDLNFRKVLFLGLLSAGMPIWLFFYPIAKNFV